MHEVFVVQFNARALGCGQGIVRVYTTREAALASLMEDVYEQEYPVDFVLHKRTFGDVTVFSVYEDYWYLTRCDLYEG